MEIEYFFLTVALLQNLSKVHHSNVQSAVSKQKTVRERELNFEHIRKYMTETNNCVDEWFIQWNLKILVKSWLMTPFLELKYGQQAKLCFH